MFACRGNLVLEETMPWIAIKKGTSAEQAEAVATLLTVLEAARIVAVMLAPVTPQLSSRVLKQLGVNASIQARSLWRIEAIVYRHIDVPGRVAGALLMLSVGAPHRIALPCACTEIYVQQRPELVNHVCLSPARALHRIYNGEMRCNGAS